MFMCDCHQVGVLVYERYHILPIYMILMSLHLGYLHELTYRLLIAKSTAKLAASATRSEAALVEKIHGGSVIIPE